MSFNPMIVETADLRLDEAFLQIPQFGPQPIPISAIEPSACTRACPAGIQVKSYVSLIAEERFREALQVVRERCPLPGVCGRVCTHPCEDVCARGNYDAPIAIRALKRFVADQELEFETEPPPATLRRDARVAIVGSGPAGLSAAWDLRRAGYGVTIFEAETEPGGLLRHGIADYRLPPSVLSHEIDYILRTGIELRTGVSVGKDVDLESLLRNGYRAVLLATGAQLGRNLGLARASTTPGVEDALSFLRRVNAGAREPLPGRVVVIGGGSTAIEAARAALRLGALSAQILYRRSEREMPASEEEIHAARTEGVEFSFLVTPRSLLTEGQRLTGLECVRCELGSPDASGRPRSIPIDRSDFVVEAERVLAAIGQDVDLSFLPARTRNELLDDERLHVEPDCRTRLAGIFAAGDLVTGPSTVIQAIATGHRAAASVKNFLEGRPHRRLGRHGVPPTYQFADAAPARASRIEPPVRPAAIDSGFEEVELAYSRADAVAEARRCLRCGPCEECRICAPSCSRRHIAMRTGAAADPREHAVIRGSAALALSLDGFETACGTLMGRSTDPSRELLSIAVEARAMRAAVMTSECRGCESCVAACPFDAIRVDDGNGIGPRSARVDAARCRGCNLCVAVCPTGAARSSVFSPDRWEFGAQPHAVDDAQTVTTTMFVCEHRMEALAEEIENARGSVQVTRVRCLGQIDAGRILDAFRCGAQRVVLGGCSDDNCHYTHGSAMSAESVSSMRAVMRSLGHEPNRLVLVRMGAERRLVS